MRKHNAFTLMELAIVLAVIGILAAILIPVLSNVITKANARSALSDARHTAEQYVMNVFEKKGAPETMVIVVYKGGVYWLFGYDRDIAHNGNRLMISKQNPYKEKDFMKNTAVNSVMDKWSYNAKHQGVKPDTSETFVADTDGTFWLVPYYDNGAKVHDVRDITLSAPSYDEEKYMLLNTSAAMDVGGSDSINASYTADGEELSTEGDILAYHGLLLPGTYTIDEEEVNTTGSDGTDYSTTYYTLSFLMGEVPFDAVAQGTTVPAPVQIPAGTTVYPASYSIQNVHEDYTYHWDRTSAFTMNRNITLTAEWEEKPTYTVTFRVDTTEGESFTDNQAKTDAKTAMEAAGFTWTENSSSIVLSSGSKKLHAGQSIADMIAMTAESTVPSSTFTGWQVNGGRIVLASSGAADKLVTGNMELTPVFSTDTVHVTINPNNGANPSETIEQDVASGSTITLPAISTFTAPSGKVFGYWSWTLSGTQFGDGAQTQVNADVTFTANWVDDELVVRYSTVVPGKASSAGLSASVPADATYTSANKPASVTIGGASLNWYTVNNYTVILPDSTSQTMNEGDTLSLADYNSGTVYITPNYVAMTATIQYRNGGYNVDNWAGLVPAAATYELIDIRNGYTICTNDLTCNEGYKFEGWLDSAQANLTNIYQPGDTYAVSESHNGKTITFIAYFNEEEMATACRIVFNFYDYQNYPMSEKANHILFTYTSNVPFDPVNHTYLTLNSELMSSNMPTKEDLRDAGMSIIVHSATGAEYECELFYDDAAEQLGQYEPITVTENTAQDTVVWIPSDIALEIDGEYYTVIKTAEGFKNIDRPGTIVVSGQACSTTLGGNYVLANNITLDSSQQTAPLGYQRQTELAANAAIFDYEGKFNGLGYTISGFKFDIGKNDLANCPNNYVGLFASIGSSAKVSNFILDMTGSGCSVNGYYFVGAVAGINEGTIKDVVVKFAGRCTVQGYAIVGGLCGENCGTVENCHMLSTGSCDYHVNAGGYISYWDTDGYTDYYYNTTAFSNGQELYGTYVGGIAGGNDGGRIVKCSVGGESNGNSYYTYGVNCVGFDNGSTGYLSYCIGGIAGANVGGMIDQCWANNVEICRYYKSSGGQLSDYAQSFQYLGGIAGFCNAATVSNCWTKNAHITAQAYAGGIAGGMENNSHINYCWTYFGGVDTFSGNSSYMGDIICSGAIDSSSVTGCAIWDACYTGTIPSGATNYNTLANTAPASAGLTSGYFVQDANGPMLTNNPFTTTWVIG